MIFGVAETDKGHVACVLQEDGVQLMVVSKPFREAFDAKRAARILNAVAVSPLAAKVVFRFRTQGIEIFETLAVQS